MRYFRPAIITLIIAVIAIFALLFYVSIVNGGNNGQNKKDKKIQTATIPVITSANIPSDDSSEEPELTTQAILTDAPQASTEASAQNEDISADGVTYPESVLQAPVTMLVAGDDLRIRTEPNTSGEILGLLYTDTEVTKYGSTGTWSYIKYRDITGWVSSEYLKPAE